MRYPLGGAIPLPLLGMVAASVSLITFDIATELDANTHWELRARYFWFGRGTTMLMNIELMLQRLNRLP